MNLFSHSVLQSLAGLEHGHLGSGDLDNFLGTGVTAGAGSAGLDLERTEANQLDLVAFLQSGGNGVQGSGDSSLSGPLGKFSGSGHGGGQVRFVYEEIPPENNLNSLFFFPL